MVRTLRFTKLQTAPLLAPEGNRSLALAARDLLRYGLPGLLS
jgi:hypothetical protein